MTNDFYAFGEILWDCLPSGRYAGGAPFNVAAHLAQLGSRASLISAVGQDEAGEELLQVARDKRVDTRFVSRVRVGLATGTTKVTVDANGNAAYELVQPAAWDDISVPDEALAALANAAALTFGSLAGRSIYKPPAARPSALGPRPAEVLRCEPASASCRHESRARAGQACRHHQAERRRNRPPCRLAADR
jgi:sugar/nucleoside kinase (ribokinase family)